MFTTKFVHVTIFFFSDGFNNGWRKKEKTWTAFFIAKIEQEVYHEKLVSFLLSRFGLNIRRKLNSVNHEIVWDIAENPMSRCLLRFLYVDLTTHQFDVQSESIYFWPRAYRLILWPERHQTHILTTHIATNNMPIMLWMASANH